MEHKLATAEKKVLVELVKQVQKRGLQGENGGWKEFLDVHDKKFGSSLSDPSKRSNDALAAFLMTFKREEDLKFFARFLQCDANRDLIQKFKEESPDKETPEQRLVRLTLEHPEYPLDYTFPSYAEDWFVTKAGKKKSKVMKSTKMIAVDCEMVLCEDGTEAVARVGVVDRELKVKLDAVVNPNKPVADYRTNITGLNAADIENATLTLGDIQKKMRRFLSSGTVLVGHSLNNDLQVLKIDHARVIDTSLIFKYSGTRKHRRPSLNNLCKSILGYEVRKDGAPHDCVNDAEAAMKLVLTVIEKRVDTTVSITKDELETEMTRLFLHRIPHNVSSEELHGVISGGFTLEVKPAKKLGGYYCAVAIFKTPEEANQTFENLEGNLEKDSSGLAQKLVTFKLSSGSGASLYVRKMVQDDDSLGEVSAKKRTYPAENTNDSKKQKTENKTEETMVVDVDRCNRDKLDNPRKSKTNEKTEEQTIVNGNHCEDHLKEIEDLKQKLKDMTQKLKEKDFQLDVQDKMISDLKKKLQNKKKAR